MKQHISIHKAVPNTGALDFSHLLDAPAGKHGFVQSRKGHFYFEDGTRARFIGFNVAQRSTTPDHETAEKLAARFASLGVNVIRLHAPDGVPGDTPCTWSAAKDSPLLDYSKGDTRSFNAEGLDRFDYFFAKLKERGIYLHIDLLVARQFLDGDELDYPGGFPALGKCYPVLNEGLTRRQMEYAKMFLTHVNPYTGLALVDDPAVMTIQLTNEESAIKSTDDTNENPTVQPYRDERKRRWNEFLLAKYDNRKNLKDAWTVGDTCDLREDEDPSRGTVDVVQGSFVQPPVDGISPAQGGRCRYADYMEFGIMLNRKFYRRMRDYVLSLGAKAPIACSNLLGGAADVYGHSDGDVMENDPYFNHPTPPFRDDNTYIIAGPAEYVSSNPLTMQRGIGSLATTLLEWGSISAVSGKPHVLAEWNEYGLHPFHSTAFAHTVAYACLNDWDGLIVYNHHTSENADDQPADEILSVFDCYNDPSVICQWGFLATVFLKGLVTPAPHRTEVVFTQNDLRTLPAFHAMPNCIFPYITNFRNVFLDSGDRYQGSADVALNAGFTNTGDLSDAEHGVYYAWSSCRDAWGKLEDKNRLARAAKGANKLEPGVHLGEQALVFDNIAEAAQMGDYRHIAEVFTKAMQSWGVIPQGTGYVDGKLISETKELIFDPDNARFAIRSDRCGYFSGAPTDVIELGGVEVRAKNERITLALLPRDSGEYLLTAMGGTGMDATTIAPGPEVMPGFAFNAVHFDGKLYADTLEGSVTVKAKSARIIALDPTGREIGEVPGTPDGDRVRFDLDGSIPSLNFVLRVE